MTEQHCNKDALTPAETEALIKKLQLIKIIIQDLEAGLRIGIERCKTLLEEVEVIYTRQTARNE